MAKFNGTGILIYSNGTEIACQTGLSISLQQALLPASTKNSAGWEEHINGQRSFNIPFDALQSTTGLSSKALYDYIIGRTNLLIFVLGFGAPIIGECDLADCTVNAPVEGAVGLTGNLKGNRTLFQIRGTNAQLLTDPDAVGTDYDTLTISGIKITSAINLGGTGYCISNWISLTTGDTYKVVFFLTKNSGELPNVNLINVISGAPISNTVAANEGVNVITLVATGTEGGGLGFSNTDAANWSTSNIYWFKV